MMAKVRRRAASRTGSWASSGTRRRYEADVASGEGGLDADGVVGGADERLRARIATEVQRHLRHHVAAAEGGVGVGEAHRAAGAGVTEARRAAVGRERRRGHEAE